MSAFSVDRGNAKLMGVCAGVSRVTGIDPLVVRLAALIALLAFGPVMILAYVATAWIAS